MSFPNSEWSAVEAAFRKIWGYSQFRPPQAEVIRSLLSRQDALIIMPTGGGKSLCFQLPALFRQGVTLVISPLVALMENQVQELLAHQLPAASLHSELNSAQRKQTLKALEHEELRLLYLSPETLLSPPVWQRLCHPQLVVNGLILDEAHCLIQWGTTFRPAYQRLGAIRPALLATKPPGTQLAIAAFTATADPQGQRIIASVLGLQQPQCFRISPYRANLRLRVQMSWTPKCRRHQLLHFIQQRLTATGLVYVATRRQSETLTQWLQSQGFRCGAYHGGLGAQQRRQLETQWLTGVLQFVVCTSAFGMGINKPDCRWVVHLQPPFQLTDYLQEIGRAGRDGKLAVALLLRSEPTGWLSPEDQRAQRFFMNQITKQYRQAQQLVQQFPPQGEIAAIAQQYPGAELALAILHRCGRLVWSDPFHYQQRSSQQAISMVQLARQASQADQKMQRYLRIRHCRWQFLLAVFGFSQAAHSLRCGHCDNCRSGDKAAR